jgi:hypothetical protein
MPPVPQYVTFGPPTDCACCTGTGTGTGTSCLDLNAIGLPALLNADFVLSDCWTGATSGTGSSDVSFGITLPFVGGTPSAVAWLGDLGASFEFSCGNCFRFRVSYNCFAPSPTGLIVGFDFWKPAPDPVSCGVGMDANDPIYTHVAGGFGLVVGYGEAIDFVAQINAGAGGSASCSCNLDTDFMNKVIGYVHVYE